jgi:hypothetical protein
VAIKGDFVCPNGLRATVAEQELAEARMSIAALTGAIADGSLERDKLAAERDEAREALKQCAKVRLEYQQQRDEYRAVLEDLSCDGCEYGDNCPPFGTNHGQCMPCKCREALDRTRRGG